MRLFPDINGYDKWRQKAHELNARIPGALFLVDDELTRSATDEEIKLGIDIADRLVVGPAPEDLDGRRVYWNRG